MNLKNILLLVVLVIISCSKDNQNESKNNFNVFWGIKYFVDQSNEPTDVGYITNTNPIYGNYSNTKTQGPLKVKIMIKEKAVGIKLYENRGDSPVSVKKPNAVEYELSLKHNNKDTNFLFRGINENNVVVIGDIISSTHQETLINYLKMGGEFDFYLESKNDGKESKYQFKINDQSDRGFIKLLEKL